MLKPSSMQTVQLGWSSELLKGKMIGVVNGGPITLYNNRDYSSFNLSVDFRDPYISSYQETKYNGPPDWFLCLILAPKWTWSSQLLIWAVSYQSLKTVNRMPHTASAPTMCKLWSTASLDHLHDVALVLSWKEIQF